jgi:hypothetical protein
MDHPLTIASVVAALLLAAVHVLTPGMRFLGGTPRSVWLSVAGGVAVAYVFVHLLPELAEGQRHVSAALAGHALAGAAGARESTSVDAPIRFAERHVYLIALGGLALFYGLDKLAKRSRGQRLEGDGPGGSGRELATPEGAATSAGVFWIHMGSFGLYNLLIGYLLVHGERRTLGALAFFTVAMALHFVVTDFGLLEDHKHRYRAAGRWVLCAALAGGLAVGFAAELPEAALAVLVAFLAGGVILNVLKEEVPSERRSRFWAFALGMVGYALLLLTL